MENNVPFGGMSSCCCCGATLPSYFVISIGNLQRVCVDCAKEILSAVEYRKSLFDNNLPVLAVVKTPTGHERMVVAEEMVDRYFDSFVPLFQARGIDTTDAFMVLQLTREQFNLIADEAQDSFSVNPFLHRSYVDHYEIAEMMAFNSTGNETEEDLEKLMLESWKAVCKSRLDNVDDIYYQGAWRDLDDSIDFIDFFNHELWIPFPDKDSLMVLFKQMIYREDVQLARANNAKWRAEQKARPTTINEES